MSATGHSVFDPNYKPPEQSRRGQLFDSVFLLALVFVVLFGVTYLYSTSTSTPAHIKPLSQLPLTQVQQQQYHKVIKHDLTDLTGANTQIASSRPESGSSKYPIKLVSLIVTFGVIALYMVFIYVMSSREYREVIREHFGPAEDADRSGGDREPAPALIDGVASTSAEGVPG